jgi:hypothetical protein
VRRTLRTGCWCAASGRSASAVSPCSFCSSVGSRLDASGPHFDASVRRHAAAPAPAGHMQSGSWYKRARDSQHADNRVLYMQHAISQAQSGCGAMHRTHSHHGSSFQAISHLLVCLLILLGRLRVCASSNGGCDLWRICFLVLLRNHRQAHPATCMTCILERLDWLLGCPVM